jgi:hypothetical protein
MLMFAYGSNLNMEQMERRCPNAVPLARMKLRGRRLVFRGVADCIAEAGAVCHGGIWAITSECEKELDLYEGVRGGLYRKEYVPINAFPEHGSEMLIYVMNSTGIFPPSAYYLNVIKQGYEDFGLSKAAHRALRDAVAESYDDKAPSHVERARYRRTGRPQLAKRPSDAGHAGDRNRNHAS